MQRNYSYITLLLLICLLGVSACQEKEIVTVTPLKGSGFQNDVIKRTLGPNVVGLDIEFAYAMALPRDMGRITSAQVEASISGASGTYLEHRSFYTDGGGADVGVVVGQPSATEGRITRVNFTADTSAATLRYFYRIPEEARGQSVNFTFSATSSNGQTVSYTMGPYTVGKMDLKLDLNVVDAGACYISIADMAVYTAAQAAANPDKIDLVYLYRTIPNVTFNHGLVSPAADAQYRPGITLPAGVNRSIKIRKAWGIRDFHLARTQFGVYIDDLDFQQLNLEGEPNFAINMRAESGAWVETADGRYRAYIYFNAINNGARSARISIKRYAL
ncbi:hypothetical protein GCM10027275_36400 [Rhabdobacter roseus]|uniref:DUF4466 domain-containing protein n=1 Tax=Rhabdobacter roseus TaxID=1655419 RepID=A0A840TXF1_9BACT|nr:DUF4466 family protein [Rhabdobacter roseus]MBB5285953.1 hypothetical protein [Rhabdobacter roseus]